MRKKIEINKEWLYKKYVIERYSAYKIANILKCSEGTIRKNLRKYNINMRKSNESKIIFNKNLNSKDYLYKEYINKKKTLKEIANDLNVSEETIRLRLKKFNIKRRNKYYKFVSTTANYSLLNNYEYLFKLYITDKKSILQISKEINCSFILVKNKLIKFKIPIRDFNGKNNHQWKGGISFEPYCSKFNNQIKEYIRDKFNRKCFLCGKQEEDNNCKLHIHHVDYNKGQGCGYSWSLIPLCKSCHAKTNYNRYYWFNLLNNYWCYKYLSSYRLTISFNFGISVS